MSLTNPINKSNIVQNFRDYVEATANSGITWGTNSRPTYSWPTTVVTNGYGQTFSIPGGSHEILPSSTFAGTTSGKTTSVPLNSTIVNATEIVNSMIAATTTLTAIRRINVKLTVTSTGDGFGYYTSGTKPTAGLVFDQTAKGHMKSNYESNILGGTTAQAFGISQGVGSGLVIDDANLISFFEALKTKYETARDNVGASVTFSESVCHANCHSNCHTARSRR